MIEENASRGYTPFFVLPPMVKSWKGSPREAAQRGLDWLQHAAPAWSAWHGCFGCHVQSQVLMGQAVALNTTIASACGPRAGSRTSATFNLMAAGGGPRQSATSFGAMGTAYAADLLDLKNDKATCSPTEGPPPRIGR